jgi:YHS domain-containing protein
MNKTIKTSLGLMAICGSIFLMACGNETTPTTDTTTTSMDSTVIVAAEDSVISYDISLVNNKKDPTCGMPVTAGISDTAHYDNKVLGFCSAGCKEEFLKNPKANIAAAEMK